MVFGPVVGAGVGVSVLAGGGVVGVWVGGVAIVLVVAVVVVVGVSRLGDVEGDVEAAILGGNAHYWLLSCLGSWGWYS